MTTSIYAFQPVWTDAGITLAHSLPDGVAVKIDAVAVGDGGGAGYLPDEAATALVNEIERSSVIGGFPLPLGRSMQLNAVIEGSALAYSVREIAFYSGATMVLVYSRIASPIIFNKTLGVGLSMPLTISLRRFHELAPDVEITIENSPDLPAMILQMQVHEAKANPHPQYAGQLALTNLATDLNARIDDLQDELNAHEVYDNERFADLQNQIDSAYHGNILWDGVNGAEYTYSIAPNKKVRVIIVAGGAGGASQEFTSNLAVHADYVANQANGVQAFVQVNGSTIATVGGGIKGLESYSDGEGYGNGSDGANGTYNLINGTGVTMTYQANGNGNGTPASNGVAHAPANGYGKGGAGCAFVTNIGVSGKGGGGAVMDFFYVNTTGSTQSLRVVSGNKGASDSSGYWGTAGGGETTGYATILT